MKPFISSECDVILLEVGLGGRLDACNLWDADVAIVTSIALDHADWLGTDLSVIATEKGAIGRPGRPLVVGEINPPSSLFELADKQGMLLDHVGALPMEKLPELSLHGEHRRRNAACALAAVTALQNRLPVSADVIDDALLDVQLAGRFEVYSTPGGITRIEDVAHNPAGAQALLDTWRLRFGQERCELVFAVLADKELDALVPILAPIARHWYLAPLDLPRARPMQTFADDMAQLVGESACSICSSVEQACRLADAAAASHTKLVLICGSFHVLEGVVDEV